MSIRNILEKNKDYIIQQIKNGKSMKELGKEFDCNSGNIWYFLKDYNIQSQYKRSNNYGQKYQCKEQVIEFFNNGESVYSISKKINISNSVVNKWLKEWGYDTSRGCKVDITKPLLKNQFNKVLELHNQGWSQDKIGNYLGYSASQISRLLKKHNIQSHPLNKYTVNENYFDTINGEYQAYILGWLYSDGNIQYDGKIRIALQEDDQSILEWIKNELQYTGPLYYKKSRSNSPKPQWELCINRKKLADRIIALGCMPKKSMILKFPSSDIIPNKLLSAFMRGYFEGDGSINKHGVQIVGTYEFVHALNTKIPCEITNIYQRYKDRDYKDSSHQLFIGRKNEIQKFAHWIYDDATIYLQRKYDIAKQYFLD